MALKDRNLIREHFHKILKILALVFILLAASRTNENYTNIKNLWNLLKIDKIIDPNTTTSKSISIDTDLKLANILAGLMQHSNCFPCIWCDISKNKLKNCGTYRTIKECMQNYELVSLNVCCTFFFLLF